MDQFLRVNIETVEELHCIGVLEDLGNLRSCGNELEHITVILDGSGAVLGSVAHFQGVFQDSDQLLDLAVVESVARDATSSS